MGVWTCELHFHVMSPRKMLGLVATPAISHTPHTVHTLPASRKPSSTVAPMRYTEMMRIIPSPHFAVPAMRMTCRGRGGVELQIF